MIAPRGADGGLSTNLGQSVTFYPTDRKRAYVQRWSLGVEQALPGQFLVEATYVGNRGTRLGILHQLDNTPAQYLSTSPTRDTQTINFLGQSFPNPFFGIITTGPLAGSDAPCGLHFHNLLHTPALPSALPMMMFLARLPVVALADRAAGCTEASGPVEH